MRNGFGQTTLSGEVKKTTDDAVLFLTDAGTEFWVPRSVCLDGQSIDEGDSDIAVATWWRAERGGLMERFHLIDDAAAILVSKGVFRQVKVFRRGNELFAGHGSGFIRLYDKRGTSLPNVSLEALEVPAAYQADRLGRLVIT